MDLLTACQMAYRKHHLNDDSIGWEELSNMLLDALCNEMGDDGYQEWLASQQSVEERCEKVANHNEGVCLTCGKWVINCKCKRTS